MAGDTVGQIKERISITDIVSPYVKLKRAGRSLVGLCPFHKEKTGSFHVSLERGTWHCFGCGEGGDGFSFIQKVEGVDFKGALKILADKAGVQIITIYGSERREELDRKERLRALMSRASEWYAGKLAGSPAETYAKKRGLTKETIENWRLGYAPEGWRALLEALSAEGFTTAELLAAGLVKEADGKPGTYYDRFRNRLMFPIRDTAGRVVGFTGRALSAEDPAKYLNSPETDLYHKSEILFGMDTAKDAIRMRGFAVLVEGQMDVLLVQQAGFGNTVALSGTALSEKHVALMKRYSENLMLVFDADAAGLKATARSAELALRQGLRVKAARLPKGKDPADLASEDAKELARRVAAGKPVVEFFLAELGEMERDPHRLLRLAESIVLPLLAAISSPMEREHFVQSTGRTLGISSEAVRESLARLKPSARNTKEIHTVNLVRAVDTNRLNSIEARKSQLLAVMHAYPETPLAKRVKSEYLRITGAQELPATTPPEPVLFEIEKVLGEGPLQDGADELLKAFEEAVIREAYQAAVGDLRRAEAARDGSAVEEAQRTCAELSHRLASLGI